MRKSSKWVYLLVVQGKYADGWEDLTQDTIRHAAVSDLLAYQENAPETQYRLITRRELRNAPLSQNDLCRGVAEALGHVTAAIHSGGAVEQIRRIEKYLYEQLRSLRNPPPHLRRKRS